MLFLKILEFGDKLEILFGRVFDKNYYYDVMFLGKIIIKMLCFSDGYFRWDVGGRVEMGELEDWVMDDLGF